MELEVQLSGIAASPGIAIGRAFVIPRSHLENPRRELEGSQVAEERRRFRRALSRSKRQLKKLISRLEAKGAGDEHTYVLEAHQMLLEDPMMLEGVQERIEQRRMNAEWALQDFLHALKESFSQIDDEYFLERGNDIDQVVQRILRNLLNRKDVSLDRVPARSIVVAHDLTPADTVHMLKRRLGGFVTELGGRTSHVALLARSMQLPALVGTPGALAQISTGDMLVLDGERGLVVVHPSLEVIAQHRQRHAELVLQQRQLSENRTLPAVTADNVRVNLAANIEGLSELDTLRTFGAEGVGLFRTEYLFMDRHHLPGEAEQYETYRTLIARIAPHSVIIRTLDLGADKGLLGEDDGDLGKKLSPALGLRGVRYCLRHPQLFEPQLRAILRAGAHGPIRLMIPMVTGIEEVRAVKLVLHRLRIQLEAEGHELPEHLPLGVMIETPSAAILADMLAKEVDFFSVGTNDLIHYTLAVDRVDERLSYLYQPVHPAVLRLLRGVFEAGANAGIEVGMCGEVAGDPLFTELLLGLGLRHFSMSPSAIPAVKDVLRRASVAEGRRLVEEALKRQSGYEIHDWLLERSRREAPQP